MNPRFSADVRTERSHAYEVDAPKTPKVGKSVFDQALEHATPAAKPIAKKAEPVARPVQNTSATPTVKAKPDDTTHADDEATLRARQIAATLQMVLPALPPPVAAPTTALAARAEVELPVGALVAPRLLETAGAQPGVALAQPEAAAPEGIGSDDEPTQPMYAPKVRHDDESGASIEGMDPVDDPAQATVAVQLAPQPLVDEKPAPSESHDRPSDHDRSHDIAALIGTNTRSVETARAVESISATREVEWQGIAEKVAEVANGSIEGNRARVVLGEGDDRIVLTVSTHAHRVAIEVETSTSAGSALAAALKHQPDELRQALSAHGLELSNGRSESEAREQHVPEEPQARTSSAPQKASTVEQRRSGVVLA